MEEVLISTVEDVDRAGETGAVFIGYTKKSGEKKYYQIFITSGRRIEKYKKELPGSQIAALKVDGRLQCLVQVGSFDKKGYLKDWKKIGEGHCTLSEIVAFQNNLPIAN